MSKQEKKVEETVKTAIVPTTPAPLPAKQELADAMATYAGQGMETARPEDIALPFLQVIQSLSPQRRKQDPKYISGAEEGMIFDTVTGTLFAGDRGVEVVPVHFAKLYNEWVPRDAGGGFVGSHRTREEAQINCQQGNQIVDTALHYVLYKRPDGEWAPAVLSMTSTKLKVSRNWLARMAMLKATASDGRKFTPPTFARRYLLTTVAEENDKGAFFNLKVEDAGAVEDMDTFQAAIAFRAAVAAGQARVNMSGAHEAAQDHDDF